MTAQINPLTGYRRFDEAAQLELLDLVRHRWSVARGCQHLGVSYTTVNKWIQRGKRTDYGNHDYHNRYFYLRLLRAREQAANEWPSGPDLEPAGRPGQAR
jgi:hypothetical protein